MKTLILPLLLLVPFGVDAQKKQYKSKSSINCTRDVTDPKRPETSVNVPCHCPKKIEDCTCYDGDWTEKYYSTHHYIADLTGFGVICIGKTHFSYNRQIWKIDNVAQFISKNDTVLKYDVSKDISQYWHIPKKYANNFNPDRWQFQSQGEEVRPGSDTIIYFQNILRKTWYLIKRDNQLSIDNIYGEADELRWIVHESNDVENRPELRMAKCFFLTGYEYNEYIYRDGKDARAEDYVENWVNGQLK